MTPVKQDLPVRQDAGQNAQLDYLMRRFGDKVFKLAYYHVRNRHDAEDITQEAFLRVYRNLGRFREDCSYYTWIYRITRNLCRDYAVSAYRRRILPWRGLDRSAQADGQESMFEAVEGGEIFRSVMDLPAKYRTVLALYYFEGMTAADIAGILNISESNVRARLCRGRKMLKELLSGEAEPNE